MPDLNIPGSGFRILDFSAECAEAVRYSACTYYCMWSRVALKVLTDVNHHHDLSGFAVASMDGRINEWINESLLINHLARVY